MNDRSIKHFPALEEQYLTYTHKSGLKVFYIEKNFRNTYVLLGVNFGSVDEWAEIDGRPLPEGTAHFLEHKMFENPDGEDTFLKFSRIGANANAYTANERTCYMFSASEQVEEGLSILLESVFSPYFTEQNVKKEKGIIIEEIKMYKDDPADALYHHLLSGIYENCPVKKNICGNIRSVSKMSPEDLFRAYKTHYRPDNMVLSICGRCNFQKVEKILDRILPSGPQGVLPSKIYPTEKQECHKCSLRLYRDVFTPMIAIGIKIPPCQGTPLERIERFASLCILAQALFCSGGSFVGRLKEQNLIPDEPSYELTDRIAFSHILFFADTYDPTALFRIFDKELTQILKEGVDPQEFLRCKRVLYAEHLEEFNSTEDCAALYLGDALEGCDGIDYSKVLSSITLKQVNNLAASLFKKEQICKCRLLPYKYRKENTQ